MQERLDYFEVRAPGDVKSIRRFIDKHRPLGIEGYERIVKRIEANPDRLLFMLGHEDERTGKPVFVAGVSTQIFEFAEITEDAVRRALLMGPKA
jgi:hypothetical protein